MSQNNNKMTQLHILLALTCTIKHIRLEVSSCEKQKQPI